MAATKNPVNKVKSVQWRLAYYRLVGEIDSNVVKRFQQPPDLFQPFRTRTRWHLTITI